MDSINKGILSIRSQYSINDNVLEGRLNTLLPALMQECQVPLWVVLCREYNEDPVFKTLTPSRMKNASRISCFIFILERNHLYKFSLCRPNPSLTTFYEQHYDPANQNQWDAIRDVLAKYSKGIIAINVSDDYALADGLSSSLYKKLLSTVPPKTKIISSEQLVIRWLETRSKLELENYSSIYKISMQVLKDAFSRNVIKPGETTTTDVEFYILQRINNLGLDAWFNPDVDLQRRGVDNFRLSDIVIEKGDLLHVDMGLAYLNLYTDTQRLAYVLKDDEIDIPKGILKGFSKGLRFQKIVLDEFQVGRTGNDIFSSSIEKAKAEGIRPMLYTHPIGLFGHSAGPTIGMYDNQNPIPIHGENSINNNTCYALELNVIESVPEWDGQDICFMLEETICYTYDQKNFLDCGYKELIRI
ncbi:MAG: M24 family metallopeptidase [Saccharofermentanales bacterium]|jgi:Xaa-Pro aminopeptidase